MVILFVVAKALDLFVALGAPSIIPYLGFFPYKEVLVDYGLPSFISSFANFDGVQYLTLVREGYNTYTQAYFPLYFLLVRTVSFLFPTPSFPRPHNDLVAALLISNVLFLGALFVYKKYLSLYFSKNRSSVMWALILLLSFPTSFFFGAVYTESLFFILFISSLYFLKRKNYVVAGLLAATSSAARLMGVFLFIPFIFHFLEVKQLKNKVARFLLVLSPFIGLSIYCIYLWASVGDPFFFFNAQPAFGANRSTSFVLLPQVYYRYFKIFLSAALNFQYLISVIEFLMFSVVLGVLIFDLVRIIHSRKMQFERMGLLLFSLINLLLPTLTGTFSSIPRYALFSISFFLILAQIKNIPLKTLIVILFTALHIVLLAFFIQGYFVG